MYEIKWNKADIAKIYKQVHPEAHYYISDGQERFGLLKEELESVFRKEIGERERKVITG
ncbi:MAG TPA: hypothetical protein VJP79_11690 [Nitrososphaera sp.]|nr:hypothetical protein [Nitrososphaera sp.]